MFFSSKFFCASLVRFFVLFSCLSFSVALAKGVDASDLKVSENYVAAIESIGRSAKKGVEKAVAEGKIGGNIAVVNTALGGTMSPKGARLVMEELSLVTKQIGSVIFVYDYSQLKNSTKRKAFAGKKGGILLEKDKWSKKAKSMGASYFATLDIQSRYGRGIRVTMTVYDSETKVSLWSDTWRARIADDHLIYDVTADLFLDNFYFFGVSGALGVDISNVAVLGFRLGALFSYVDTSGQYTDKPHWHTYRSGVALVPQMELAFSLINSSKPSFTIFDLEFFVRGGALLGAFVFRVHDNLEYSLRTPHPDEMDFYKHQRKGSICGKSPAGGDPFRPGTPCARAIEALKHGENSYGTFYWRPTLVAGLNFLFVKKFYLFAGADFGPLMGKSFSHGGTVKVLHKPIVIPLVGFGYRDTIR